MPWTRWLTTSYDDGLALRDAVHTRRLMKTDWYERQKTLEWEFVGDQNVKSNYVNNRTGWRIAASIQGEITGNHAHRVVVDDPHHVKRAESDQIRSTTLSLWRETFPSRADLPSSVRLVVGQRTHEEDLSADWLEREGERIHHIELKMEYEKPQANAQGSSTRTPSGGSTACSLTGRPHDPRTEEGEMLVPSVRMPIARYQRLKIDLGPYAHSAQYQQAPTPRKGAVLDPSWFPQTPRLERSQVDLIATIDLNYSEIETSDWTWCQLAAVDKVAVLPRIHLVHAIRAHLAEKDHLERIGEWLLMFRPTLVGIEKRAWEKQGATRDLCLRLMGYCEQAGWSLAIEPIEADTDKVTRAMIITGRAQAGLITADKHTDWWPELSKQMSTFPRSTHDDGVDAVAYIVRLVALKLESARAMQAMLGHSSQLQILEDKLAESDWGKATMAGIR